MESSSQHYCLRWNNHRSNLLTVFEELLENEAFTDVTLAVDSGASVKCHKMVLAACSSYFQNLFVDLPCKHPIVVLKDVKHREIKAILEYMYRGEVNVAQDQLAGLLKVAEVLKVKGLVDEHGAGPRTTASERDGNGPAETTSSPPPAISTSTATSSSAAQSNGHNSISPPPHSTENSYNYFYGKHQLADGSRSGRQTTHGNPPLPVWPMSTGLPLSQHHPSSAHRQSSMEALRPDVRVGRNYEDECEASTSSLKRKFAGFPMSRDTPILRTVLGQGHADSSQPLRPDSRENNYRGNASFHETERRNSTDRSYAGEPAQSSHLDVSMIEDDEKQPSPQSYSVDTKSGTAGYMSAQKPEWKRYKQYTREDMMSAIDAVKAGMSALQAARKYGVPPRTLYDKVKKMGITTTRPLKRGANGSGACFPYGIGGNANGSIYANSFYDNETENNGSPSLENTSPALESAYVKWRDVGADSVHRITEAPAPHVPHPLVKQIHEEDEEDAQEEEEEEEAQVEDLSVNRKIDLRVIVPPTTLVKEESNVSSDNFSNN